MLSLLALDLCFGLCFVGYLVEQLAEADGFVYGHDLH
jgi:hypothetical protein